MRAFPLLRTMADIVDGLLRWQRVEVQNRPKKLSLSLGFPSSRGSNCGVPRAGSNSKLTRGGFEKETQRIQGRSDFEHLR
jgi:hypothetical protein